MPVRPRLLVAVVLAAVTVAACSSAPQPRSTPPRLTTPTTTPARTATLIPSPHRTSPAPTRHAANPLPLRADTGAARQLVTVVAPSARSTTATLQAWTRSSTGWQHVGPAIPAHVGSAGLSSHPREGASVTPIGSFGLTQAFGSAADPSTRMPYFRTDAADWWVSDTASRYYNTHYRCSGNCPFDTSAGENLLAAGHVYAYAVVIDYNRFPVRPGAGSAFFLHVTDGNPTAGCVSIPEADLVTIMKWLDPSAHPRIVIGVT